MPLFLLVFLNISLFGFTIEFSTNHPEMILNENSVEYPFTGGFNTPKIQWLDWDNDEDLDLFLLDEGGTIRLYENVGNLNNPSFQLSTPSFQNIQNIRWFYFADFNNDENLDLMIQNPESTSHILMLDNVSQNSEVFTDIITDEGNPVLSDGVMTPTFVDIDADGDQDFFTGNMYGTVTFYENIGQNNMTPIYQYISNTWQDIYIVGPSHTQRHGASAIHFIDLDNDGDFDLSWGDYYQQSLYIIWNIGTASQPLFDIENILNQYPLNDPIVSAGQNMPTFADIDGDNDKDLFITVLSGAYGFQLTNNFYFYENTGGATSPYFELHTQNYFETIDFFSDVAPEFVDIDADGDMDLFIGTAFDMSEIPWTGRIKFFRNIGSNTTPMFNLEDTAFLGTNIGNNLVPEFVDIDADNDMDVFIGDANGHIWFYRNQGDAFQFDFQSEGLFENIDLSGFAVPRFHDIDNDGDVDLFIGELTGNIHYFNNMGTPEMYDFEFITDQFQNIHVEYKSAPDFIDLDADGDADLLIGSGNNNVVIYTNNAQQFELDNTTEIPFLGQNIIPATTLFGTENNHLFTGISTGGMFHLNIYSCEKGDVNQDSSINVNDILIIVNFIINDIQPTQLENCSADMNFDSIINILDIIEIVHQIIVNY